MSWSTLPEDYDAAYTVTVALTVARAIPMLCQALRSPPQASYRSGETAPPPSVWTKWGRARKTVGITKLAQHLKFYAIVFDTNRSSGTDR